MFIYVFVDAGGLSQVAVRGGCSLVVGWWFLLLWSLVSRTHGFRQLQRAGSTVEVQAVESADFRSCEVWVQYLWRVSSVVVADGHSCPAAH